MFKRITLWRVYLLSIASLYDVFKANRNGFSCLEVSQNGTYKFLFSGAKNYCSLISLPPRGRWHGEAVTEGDCDLYRVCTLPQSASQIASFPFVGFADVSPTGNYSQREPLKALSNRHINRNLLYYFEIKRS